jgi:hypothetical protein
MSHWETAGHSDEWYTPKYIFDALGCTFGLDVAHPKDVNTHVPCEGYLYADALKHTWRAQGRNNLVWMNAPFGGRNSLELWLDKFFAHGNGIALTPDRTSAPWWQKAARRADLILFINGKVKFERPDGTVGKSPSNGTTLFSTGWDGRLALTRASDAGLGILVRRYD